MNEQTWTREQYEDWLKTRGESSRWNIADCRKADLHIRAMSLENFKKKIKGIPRPIAKFVETCVWAHFGSVEVDTLMKELECYPSWVDKGEQA